MKFSRPTMRGAAIGAVGTGAVTAAMLLGGVPVAAAAPTPVVSSAVAGPHGPAEISAGPAVVPAGWGHHRGWHGWHGWVNGRWWNRW